MSLQSTAYQPNPKRRLPKFPFLGISKYNGAIVLFTNISTGTVVRAGNNGGDKVGAHSQYWNTDSFDVYYGKVTLKTVEP